MLNTSQQQHQSDGHYQNLNYSQHSNQQLPQPKNPSQNQYIPFLQPLTDQQANLNPSKPSLPLPTTNLPTNQHDTTLAESNNTSTHTYLNETNKSSLAFNNQNVLNGDGNTSMLNQQYNSQYDSIQSSSRKKVQHSQNQQKYIQKQQQQSQDQISNSTNSTVPAHQDFQKFIQIFASSSTSKDQQLSSSNQKSNDSGQRSLGCDERQYNMFVNRITNCMIEIIQESKEGLQNWIEDHTQGKFRCAKLGIELPHNPLFHMMKTFLDFLIESCPNQQELQRLSKQIHKLAQRIIQLHVQTMNDIIRKNVVDQTNNTQDESQQNGKQFMKVMIAKDKSKVKRWLTKIFNKLRQNGISYQTHSPDPLDEHSNSVQEPHSRFINNNVQQSSTSQLSNTGMNNILPLNSNGSSQADFTQTKAHQSFQRNSSSTLQKTENQSKPSNKYSKNLHGQFQNSNIQAHQQSSDSLLVVPNPQKIQFNTSTNFFPAKSSSQSTNHGFHKISSDKSLNANGAKNQNQQSNQRSKILHSKQYIMQDTNLIKEESSEDNLENKSDDEATHMKNRQSNSSYNQNSTQSTQKDSMQQKFSQVVLGKSKYKKQYYLNNSQLAQIQEDIARESNSALHQNRKKRQDQGQSIQHANNHQNYNSSYKQQQSPRRISQGFSYQNQNDSSFSKIPPPVLNSYQDNNTTIQSGQSGGMNSLPQQLHKDRHFMNRTPMVENLQHPHQQIASHNNISSSSLPRQTQQQNDNNNMKYMQHTHTEGSPVDSQKQLQYQFTRNNNLQNFNWNNNNKQSLNHSNLADEHHELQQQRPGNQGSRPRKADYNLIEGKQIVRPSTRNNQRRPVSRYAMQNLNNDQSNTSLGNIHPQQQQSSSMQRSSNLNNPRASNKMEQQMRNTYFGEQQFPQNYQFRDQNLNAANHKNSANQLLQQNSNDWSDRKKLSLKNISNTRNGKNSQQNTVQNGNLNSNSSHTNTNAFQSNHQNQSQNDNSIILPDSFRNNNNNENKSSIQNSYNNNSTSGGAQQSQNRALNRSIQIQNQQNNTNSSGSAGQAAQQQQQVHQLQQKLSQIGNGAQTTTNHDQISTQESTGSHFLNNVISQNSNKVQQQHSNLGNSNQQQDSLGLNKSLESNSQRSITQQNQVQKKTQQQSQSTNQNTSQSNIQVIMGGTQYEKSGSNAFKYINQQNQGKIQKKSNQHVYPPQQKSIKSREYSESPEFKTPLISSNMQKKQQIQEDLSGHQSIQGHKGIINASNTQSGKFYQVPGQKQSESATLIQIKQKKKSNNLQQQDVKNFGKNGGAQGVGQGSRNQQQLGQLLQTNLTVSSDQNQHLNNNQKGTVGNTNSQQANYSRLQGLRSHNTTQEGFYQQTQNNQNLQQNQNDLISQKNKQFYQQQLKSAQQQSNTVTEVKQSLDFIQQSQTNNNQGSHIQQRNSNTQSSTANSTGNQSSATNILKLNSKYGKMHQPVSKIQEVDQELLSDQESTSQNHHQIKKYGQNNGKQQISIAGSQSSVMPQNKFITMNSQIPKIAPHNSSKGFQQIQQQQAQLNSQQQAQQQHSYMIDSAYQENSFVMPNQHPTSTSQSSNKHANQYQHMISGHDSKGVVAQKNMLQRASHLTSTTHQPQSQYSGTTAHGSNFSDRNKRNSLHSSSNNQPTPQNIKSSSLQRQTTTYNNADFLMGNPNNNASSSNTLLPLQSYSQSHNNHHQSSQQNLNLQQQQQQNSSFNNYSNNVVQNNNLGGNNIQQISSSFHQTSSQQQQQSVSPKPSVVQSQQPNSLDPSGNGTYLIAVHKKKQAAGVKLNPINMD